MVSTGGNKHCDAEGIGRLVSVSAWGMVEPQTSLAAAL